MSTSKKAKSVTRKAINVFVDEKLWNRARGKMAKRDDTVRSFVDAALQAYVKGELEIRA